MYIAISSTYQLIFYLLLEKQNTVGCTDKTEDTSSQLLAWNVNYWHETQLQEQTW